MGAHTTTNQSFISHYERYVSTTQGRDKLLRLIQHSARLCSWPLFLASNQSHAVATLMHVIREISLARKLLRTGNFLYLFKKVVHASLKPIHDPIIHFASIGRYIALTCYLILDASTLPDALGVWKWDKAKIVQKETARLWLASLIFNLVIQLRTLYALRQAVLPASVSGVEADGAIRDNNRVVAQKSSTAKLQIISDFCDLPLATSSLGVVHFNNGVLGGCGTISSAIGIYHQWKAMD